MKLAKSPMNTHIAILWILQMENPRTNYIIHQ